MKTILTTINKSNHVFSMMSKSIDSVALLALRLYTSWMFFPAGLLKLKDWDTTLFLFEEEYHVPLLSPVVAAWTGTASELILPILLSLGLLTRFSALGLFFVNIVAVVSLSEIAPAALTQHMLWGLSMLVIVIWGAGYFSLDRLIRILNSAKND